jgi:phosphoribosylanthranilate isomerase
MVRVKVCGITNIEDALAAVEAGADALGFVFVPGTPRYLTANEARNIIAALPPLVTKVGVFMNAPSDEVLETCSTAGLDIVQLHGSESPDYCDSLALPVIKTVRMKDKSSLTTMPEFRVAAFLLDTYIEGVPGGTGLSFDWNLAQSALSFGPIILSGGLKPENVKEAIRMARPYAVDVSSGVESSPGHKDHNRLLAFVRAAKGVG